jgi:hypothetical protein
MSESPRRETILRRISGGRWMKNNIWEFVFVDTRSGLFTSAMHRRNIYSRPIAYEDLARAYPPLLEQ